MATVERSILIQASPAAIDQIALDASRLREWYVGVEDARPDSRYPEVDSQVVLVYKAAGVTFNLAMIVQDIVHGDHIRYQMTGMMMGTQDWTYTREGDSTRLTAQVEYEMPGGVLGKIADKLVVERLNVKNLEQSLENLRVLAEG